MQPAMEQFSSKVKQHTTVFAPSLPKCLQLHKQPFTPIDRHIGMRACVLPWALVFASPLDASALAAALAETLDDFPMLAGRVEEVHPEQPPACCPRTKATRQTWQLCCSNDGVPMEVHSSSWNLKRLLASGQLTCRRGFSFPVPKARNLPKWLPDLSPAAVLVGEAPLLSVRLTQLAQGSGSILAVTAAHVALDGRSFTRFLQHWAARYSGTRSSQPGPGLGLPPAESAAGLSDKRLLIQLMAAAAGRPAGECSAEVAAAAAGSASGRPVRAAATPRALQQQASPGSVDSGPAAAATAASWSADAAAFLTDHTASAARQASQKQDWAAAGGLDEADAAAAAQEVPALPGAPGVPAAGTAAGAELLLPVLPFFAAPVAVAAAPQPPSTTAEATDLSSSLNTVSCSTSSSTPRGAVARPAGLAGLAAIRVLEEQQTQLQQQQAVKSAANSSAAVAVAPAALGAPSVPHNSPRVPAADGHHTSDERAIATVQAAAAEAGATAATASALRKGAGQAAGTWQVSVPGQAHVLPVQGADFSYTPDPLFATRVLPPGWTAAARLVVAAVRQLQAEKQHISRTTASSQPAGILGWRPAGTNSLSTELLHIPAAALQKLKAAASLHCAPGQYISTNDAVSALVWVLMCQLRRRPLPGQQRPPELQDTCLGLAVDLRTLSQVAASSGAAPAACSRGLTSSNTAAPAASDGGRLGPAGGDATAWVDLHQLAAAAQAEPEIQPATPEAAVCEPPAAFSQQQQPQQQQAPAGLPLGYFGSAAWSIHVRACSATGEPIELADMQAAAANAGAGAGAAAARLDPLRVSPSWHRGLTAAEWALLCSDEQLLRRALAAGAARVRGALQAARRERGFAGRLLEQVAASVEAPSASQQLAMGAALVHRLDTFITSWQFPVWEVEFGGPPVAFQGLVHPVPPYHAVAMPAPPAQGGVWLSLSLPSCLVQSLVASPVLRLLAPDARWLSL